MHESESINGYRCKAGQEVVEEFTSSVIKKTLVQYDYRTLDGILFTCIGKTVEECRQKRDEWLIKKEKVAVR